MNKFHNKIVRQQEKTSKDNFLGQKGEERKTESDAPPTPQNSKRATTPLKLQGLQPEKSERKKKKTRHGQ